jgi:HSP20 family protein
MALTDLVPWKWGEKNVPVKREEADPLYALHREMDRLFDDFMGRGFGMTRFGDVMDRYDVFNPRVDVTETDQEIKLAAELPGLDEKDIEVSLSGDVLTISGEKKVEHEDKQENYYRMERSYGSFQRSIPLPSEVDSDKIEATFSKGVLHISLPKVHPGTGVKKISVKTS